MAKFSFSHLFIGKFRFIIRQITSFLILPRAVLFLSSCKMFVTFFLSLFLRVKSFSRKHLSFHLSPKREKKKKKRVRGRKKIQLTPKDHFSLLLLCRNVGIFMEGRKGSTCNIRIKVYFSSFLFIN